MIRSLLLIIFLIFPALALAGRSGLPRLYTGVILVSCQDGDTCTFNVPMEDAFFGRFIMPGRMVRLSGIDAPEVRDSQCPYETGLAVRARNRLLMLLKAAKRIDLIANGDGGNRGVLARVLADGVDVAQILIAEGLGSPWKGMREEWC